MTAIGAPVRPRECTTMGDAVIVSATRTAIGSARRGSLVDYDAFDLGKFAVAEALKRSGVPVYEVDDIVLGEGRQIVERIYEASMDNFRRRV